MKYVKSLIATKLRAKRKLVAFLLTLLPLTLLFYQSVWAYPFLLPDTGQTKCYNNTEETTCPQPGDEFYGQDASYLINPPSYTKLDAEGNDLPDSTTEWSMVRDNVTGLIWEVKTNDGSVHDKDNTYTWQDAQDVFIAELNSSSFGANSDWRVPTIEELVSIVNFGTYSPVINTDYFPNTVTYLYWSSTTLADIATIAWTTNFGAGGTYDGYGKSDTFSVRAVRGEQTGSFEYLVINAGGTVTDTSTGLMWQKATALGTYTWEDALSYCDGLSLAEYTDWCPASTIFTRWRQLFFPIAFGQ